MCPHFLELCRTLPNEIWEHIFTHIPEEDRGQSALALTRAYKPLSNCWLLPDFRLTGLLQCILRRQRRRFYLKAYFHARRVHTYEMNRLTKVSSEVKDSCWSSQFPPLSYKDLFPRIYQYERKLRCKICKRQCFNFTLVGGMRCIQKTVWYTTFDFCCPDCTSRLTDCTTLGSVRKGLDLGTSEPTTSESNQDDSVFREVENLRQAFAL